MSNLPSDQQDNWITKNLEMDFSDPTIKHDKIIVLEGQKFHVMSDLLSFSSEFFETLFNKDSGFKEANEKDVEVKKEDVTAEEFKQFLQVIYPMAPIITAKNYLSIANLATRFLAGPVIQKCRLFILDNFDKLDAIDVLEFAFKYNMEDLKAKVATFLRKDTVNKCTACKSSYCSTCTKNTYNYPHTYISSVYSTYMKSDENIKRIEALPAEIQVFIFHLFINPKKYPV